MLRLLRYDQSPPGGIQFYENQNGIEKFWPDQYSIRELSRHVCFFRQANGLPRATIEEAFQDIDLYNAQRVRDSQPKRWQRWVLDTDQAYVAPAIATRRGGCSGCGAPLK